VICPPVEAGTPDILASIHGRFVGIELKTSKGKISKIQHHRIGQIERSGGVAEAVRNKEDLFDLLSRLESTKPSAERRTPTKRS